MKFYFSWLIKFAFSLLIIILLINKSDTNFIFNKIRSVDKFLFLFSILFLFLHALFAAIRFQSLVYRIAKLKISFLQIVQNYLSSYFIGMFFLGALGFDFWRYLFLKDKKISPNKNLSILIFDRLFAALFSFFIAYIGLSIFIYFYYPFYFPYFISIFLIILFLIFSFYFFRPLRNFLMSRVPNKKSFLSSNFSICFHDRFFYFFSLNFFISSLFSAISFYLLLHSVNLSISFIDCMYLSASILLVNALPVSISGWGIREFFLVKILSLYNVNYDSALTFSFLYGLSLFIISVPGAFLLIFHFFQKKEIPFFERIF